MTAPHTFRFVIWEVSAIRLEIYSDFRAVMMFLFDFMLVPALVLSMALCVLNPDKRNQVAQTVMSLIRLKSLAAWVVLLCWMLLSILWSSEKPLALSASLRVGTGLVVALIIASNRGEQEQRIFVSAMVIGAFFQSLLAVLQVIYGSGLGLTAIGEIQWSRDAIRRAYGLTVNPNNLAGYLLIGLFAWVALARVWTVRGLILPTLVGSIIALGLLVTLSRAALVASTLILPPMIGLIRNRYQLGWRVVFIFFGILLLLTPIIFDNVSHRLATSMSRSDVIADRILEGFEDTIPIFRMHPLRGVGAGNLMVTIANQGQSEAWPILPAHNVYIVVLAELGGIGGIVFLAACLTTLFGSFRKRSGQLLSLWPLCFLAVCLVMLLDFYFWFDYRSR